jgi:hypothetical protein
MDEQNFVLKLRFKQNFNAAAVRQNLTARHLVTNKTWLPPLLKLETGVRMTINARIRFV